MLTLMCPKCGKEKNKDSFTGKVCSDCYMDKRKIIELKIREISLCKKCGREKNKFKWASFSEDEVIDKIAENIKVDLDEYELQDIELDFYKNKIVANVSVKGKLNGKSIASREEFNLPLTYQYCEDCYKSISDYFVATVQIRYDHPDEYYIEILGKKTLNEYLLKLMNSVIKEQRKEGDFLANVQKVEVVKNGLDIYVGSKRQALEFIKAIKPIFRYERKDSTSLIGMDKRGKEKIRYTFLVRLV